MWEFKGRCGKVLWNIVRVKFEELEELGVVREVFFEDNRGRIYIFLCDVVRKWLELIGMLIRFEYVNDY